MSQILTPKQLTAISALLVGDITSAAEKSGVARETVSQWVNHDEDFKAALKQAEASVIDEACRRLAGTASKAITALESVLDDPEASHGVKTRAANVILDQLTRLREYFNLEARITALENMQNDNQN